MHPLTQAYHRRTQNTQAPSRLLELWQNRLPKACWAPLYFVFFDATLLLGTQKVRIGANCSGCLTALGGSLRKGLLALAEAFHLNTKSPPLSLQGEKRIKTWKGGGLRFNTRGVKKRRKGGGLQWWHSGSVGSKTRGVKTSPGKLMRPFSGEASPKACLVLLILSGVGIINCGIFTEDPATAILHWIGV
jgi:hypothetical protein